MVGKQLEPIGKVQIGRLHRRQYPRKLYSGEHRVVHLFGRMVLDDWAFNDLTRGLALIIREPIPSAR